MIVLDKKDELAPNGYGCWSDNTEFTRENITRPFNIENILDVPQDGKVHFSYKWCFSEGYYFDNAKSAWRWIECPAGSHYPRVVSVNSPKSYSFSGPHIYGIYAVEEVLAHEMQHCYTHTIYDRTNKSKKDSDLRIEYNFIDWLLNSEKVIRFCDFLSDSDENGRYAEYLFDDKCTDTYNLGSIKGSQYAWYGDDEFLAMMAANDATKEGRAIAKNDWAFPGEQSFLPDGVRNGWKVPTTANFKLSSAKVNKLLGNDAVSSDSITQISSVGRVTLVEERETPNGCISLVRFALPISVAGVNELRVVGVLTDRDGNFAASSFAFAENGNSIIELVFLGKDIYESGLEGPFHLDRLVFSDFNGYDSIEFASTREIEGEMLNATHEDFARNDAYLLDIVNETVTTNGIVVSVNVDVHAAGEYGIVATLVNTNGASVASSSVVTNCVQGTNCIDMVFTASDIIQSNVNGPYVIDNIALYKDGFLHDA